uniref:Uncharacterized protein MANES_06G171800 n=1 Tax=Rhizophora mucronata TaxID=61149 RepID=A0A2P2KGN1_RHIMU
MVVITHCTVHCQLHMCHLTEIAEYFFQMALMHIPTK